MDQNVIDQYLRICARRRVDILCLLFLCIDVSSIETRERGAGGGPLRIHNAIADFL